jgi:glycerophosphoryl diester phosphodiesterase
MKRMMVVLLTLLVAPVAHAAAMLPGGVQLLCHRTANEDVPENTLESLEEAALLGCNIVEIDLRRTLDGKIVLNHDGILEHLTYGVGQVETSYYDDLRLRDFGGWMGERFEGMQMPLFDDALRLARDHDIRLILDIKDKGIGADILRILEREGMLQRVRFHGEWDDVKQLYPQANEEPEATWVSPGVTADQVKALHREGKAVIANFSANPHEMDLASMKAAVAAGADGINVDFPRLGADAVGRPVERTLAALAEKANSGTGSSRADAILQLSRYRGFALQTQFIHWLLDPDDHVSRAAAVALVTARPRTPASSFAQALQSPNADARANAAWALGRLTAPASLLLPLLRDSNLQVLQATLLALSRASGDVDAQALLPFLSHPDFDVRGAAAMALARHQPAVAIQALPARLSIEVKGVLRLYDDYMRSGGNPQLLTPAQIVQITGYFRCEMKIVQGISMLKGPDVMKVLEELAFRPGQDFAEMNSIVASFQLWDRIGADPEAAVQALGSDDFGVANRAEWMLVQAGPQVLPQVRTALQSSNPAARGRAIRIVAWQGDTDSLATLHTMQAGNSQDASLAAWAIAKIESLHPPLQDSPPKLP